MGRKNEEKNGNSEVKGKGGEIRGKREEGRGKRGRGNREKGEERGKRKQGKAGGKREKEEILTLNLRTNIQPCDNLVRGWVQRCHILFITPIHTCITQFDTVKYFSSIRSS